MPSGFPFAALRELAREGPVAFTVRGVSMAPRLVEGDRVAIAPARFYWPGDVVAFRNGDGHLIVHRFLGYRRHAGRLAGVTRGDAAPLPDAPVPLGQLLGRVVGTGALVTPADRVRAALGFLGWGAAALARRLRR